MSVLKKRFSAVFVAAVFLFAVSCQQEAAGDQTRPEVFFDLVKYFEQEAQRLESASQDITKRASLNGKQEEASPENLNYEDELKVFKQSDINRMSWIDKYQADTLYEGDNLSKITYRALDETLRTKKIEITFDRESISAVAIENSTKNLVASANQLLSYRPGKGYTIDNEQEVLFSKKRHLIIEVAFKIQD